MRQFMARVAYLSAIIAILAVTPATQAGIEAVKGKRYVLTQAHGPWMVMVAAIRDVEEGRRIEGGMTAEQAADTLVYELRKQGIPAYVFHQNEKHESLPGSAGNGGYFVSQHEYITVLAGNFPSRDDEKAQIVLEHIQKEFKPSFLTPEEKGGFLKRSGALFASTPGNPGPLSKAMLTVNPLLDPSELQSRSSDNLLATLNADMEYSLLKNKGKYTLVVASFSGKSLMQIGHTLDSNESGKFEAAFGSNLDESFVQAWSLTEALRSAKKFGYEDDYEAWVFHDRYRSVVTIGSFDSPNDPRLRTLATQFGAKPAKNPRTGEAVEVAEYFTIPRVVEPGKQPDRSWVFEGRPHLMAVPKINR
ncbi:MAG: hypothetical protein KDA96_19135 [Planctomycetaceae bacterium]|nr:hypothetical protein [Planctomycetaceae bacterium]